MSPREASTTSASTVIRVLPIESRALSILSAQNHGRHGRGDERHDDVAPDGRETDDAGVPLLVGLEVHAHERSALVERRAVHRAAFSSTLSTVQTLQ